MFSVALVCLLSVFKKPIVPVGPTAEWTGKHEMISLGGRLDV